MTKVQSCFLPNTKIQFAWDSTSLGYIKTCPRLYQYIMVDGWGSGDESIHLRFGQEYHSALQNYDIIRAQGIAHEAALREVVWTVLKCTWEYPDTAGLDLDTPAGMSAANAPGRPWTVDEDIKAGKYKNRRTLLRLVIDYLDKHRDDPAKTHILDSGKPAVELSFRFELDWGPKAGIQEGGIIHDAAGGQMDVVETTQQPYLLSGHLDRVVKYQEELFVMDHKTTITTPGSYFFDQFTPNNQMTLYTVASKVILDAPVKGVIISAAQICLEQPNKFIRGFTFRTGDQLEEWLDDLRYWFGQAESFATAGYWPMNDTACDKFGGCRFREICSKSPGVRQQYLKSKFTQLPEEERWNPLKPR